MTSDKGFGDRGELLGDTVVATAALDRLLHHSHVLNIRVESYRLGEKRQSGLLDTGQPASHGVVSVLPPSTNSGNRGWVKTKPATVGQI